MNIQRLIKGYFAFIMTIVTVGALTYNEDVEQYMASVFHIDETSGLKTDITSSAHMLQSSNFIDSLRVFPHSEGHSLVTMDIENTPSQAFAVPGAEDKEIARFIFTTSEYEMSLEKLTLRVVGADTDYIDSASFMAGDEQIDKASVVGDYLVFSNINHKIDQDTQGVLTLNVNLGEDLHTGQRIGVRVESHEDIEIVVGGEIYNLPTYFPTSTKYISIAKSRPWGLGIKYTPGS